MILTHALEAIECGIEQEVKYVTFEPLSVGRNRHSPSGWALGDPKDWNKVYVVWALRSNQKEPRHPSNWSMS